MAPLSLRRRLYWAHVKKKRGRGLGTAVAQELPLNEHERTNISHPAFKLMQMCTTFLMRLSVTGAPCRRHRRIMNSKLQIPEQSVFRVLQLAKIPQNELNVKGVVDSLGSAL
jgi:hypothetical protein